MKKKSEQIWAAVKALAAKLWRIVSHNLMWKILSVVIAILMWSYIVSADSSITRTKVLSSVDVSLSGQSVLQSRLLAVVMDEDEALASVRVKVKVPQANYARVTADSVSVELDLSRVRQTGRQEVELVGTTAYGEVVQITPSTLEVDIEPMDTRVVPVNVELQNQDEDKYYYVVSQSNPSQLTISGASSVVQRIAQAQALVNVEGMTTGRNVSVKYALLDEEGSEVTQLVSKPTSSVMVGLSIDPIARLSVDASIETATTGTLPDGYRITRVEVQPETITVAGDPSLLGELDVLTFEQVNVTGRTQSFSTVATVNALDAMKYVSTRQVTVTVYIEEESQVARFENVELSISGLREGCAAELSDETVRVKATGAYSEMGQLTESHLLADVDLTGLTPGEYDLPVQVTADNYPSVTFEVEPQTVHVAIRTAG
ncbi:MAG: CdaR family protein [Eubacteriales bacterium]|nr:CdaR family protein [bacterium]MDY2793040.1 CdaR family protein [Eubacteriales bacterium]